MTDVLLSPTNFWFSISLIAVFFIFILELVSTIFGISLLGLAMILQSLMAMGFLIPRLPTGLISIKFPFLFTW